MTGTMPEEEMDKLAVISCIGNLVSEINTKELQDKGILAKIHITVMQLQDPLISHGTYQNETKWLTTDVRRMQYIAEQIKNMAAETGNTLILTDRIATGELLESMIPGAVFVSGATKSKERKEQYESVQTSTNKVLIATFGIASTGTNIPKLFNLVLLEPGKGFVKVVQSIGRGLRVTPEKDFIRVYDICSNSKYSKRHLSKRKQFYEERQYEYSIVKPKYF